MLHRSMLLFWSWLAFMAGVFFLPWWLLIIGVGLIGLRYPAKHRFTLVLWLSVVVLLGWWRYHTYPPNLVQVPYGQTQTISGVVSQPPLLVLPNQQIIFSANGLPGKVQAKIPAYPTLEYGDLVTIKCQFAQPQPVNGFAYDKYLARYHVYTLCQNGRVEQVEPGYGNMVLAWIYGFRTWMTSQIDQLWPQPVSSLISGVILGVQDFIPADITTIFRRTGTVHILVVSGAHVVILLGVVTSLCQRWLSRKQIIVVSVFVLLGLCIITGLSASVIRASLMGILPQIALLLGRRRIVHLGLASVAGVMTVVNPYILVHDVGFQLSFLATLGLIYLQPIFSKYLRWIPNWFWLRESITTSIAAMLPTLPLTIGVFHAVSLVNLPANVMVLPVSNLMLFGGIGTVGLSALHLGWLAQSCAWVVWEVVSLMLRAQTYLSNLPWAYLQF